MGEGEHQLGFVLANIVAILLHYFPQSLVVDDPVGGIFLEVLIEVLSFLIVGYKCLLQFTQFLHVDSLTLKLLADALDLLVQSRCQSQSRLLFGDWRLAILEWTDVAFIEPLGLELVVEP